MKKIYISILAIFLAGSIYSQPLIDKIVAQVGDKIILQSEVEQFYYEELQKGEVPEDYRCRILQELITQKLMLIQAAKDSIIVTEDEVESNIDNRIRYFIQMFGTQEKMEEFYGKSVAEIKEEFRDDVRNLLLIQRMQEKIFGEMSVSPVEVREFFSEIPPDSLPFINAEIEYAHLVIIPKPNAEQKQIARDKAEDIRKRIIAGEDFCKLAGIYSTDASKDNCGDLGCMTRESFVTEFSAEAFKLKPGELSELVETEFGFHIIRLDSRQGDKACLKHILIPIPVTNLNFVAANKKMDSVRAMIISGKSTFCDAVKKYSDDQSTNRTCGMIVNQQTGETSFEISQLSPDDYYSIENLKPGEISQALPYTTEENKKAVRLVMLNSQTSPHVISLREDYAKLQNAALSQKQVEVMTEWITEKVKKEYIRIDPTFNDCHDLNMIIQTANN
ncbi:MAG: peptidylprolyl isomerase [Chitinophagales bacterium]